MRFRTKVSSAKEVLIVGYENMQGTTPEEWLVPGRWKISMVALEEYLTERLKGKSFGSSIDQFFFCFEIADFEKWKVSFTTTADYTSYRPKMKAIASVGQLRWSDVKNLSANQQLRLLRDSIRDSILRVGEKKRKPKDFDYVAFATVVDGILAEAPEDRLLARPGKYR